jgi:hypothetical protein
MAEDERKDIREEARGPDETPERRVQSGAGRRDEVGHTGIYPATGPEPPSGAEVRTPGDLNAPRGRVRQDAGLQGAERLPRLGTEDDKPADDRFGE